MNWKGKKKDRKQSKTCTQVHMNWLVLSSLFSLHSCFFRFKGTFFFFMKGSEKTQYPEQRSHQPGLWHSKRGHLIGILPSRLLSYDVLFSVCLKQDLRKKQHNTSPHFNVCLFLVLFCFFFFSYQKPGEKKMIFCTIAQGKNA